jgi:hypothetical protein
MEDNTGSVALSQEGALDRFVEQLIAEKKVPRTEQLKADLLQKLNDAILTEILMNLPDYLLDKINAAYDENKGGSELIEGVIKESGVNTEQIIEKTLTNFRDEYLA